MSGGTIEEPDEATTFTSPVVVAPGRPATVLRALAGLTAAGLWIGCLPTTVERLRGGTGGPYQALLAALVPWTLPVLSLAVGLALVARGRRPLRPRPEGRRRRSPLSAVLVAVPVVSLVLHGVWVAPSVLPDLGRRSASAAPAGGESLGSQRLRVLALNLEYGEADAATVVDVVRRERISVLLAVELTPQAVTRLRLAGLEGLLPSAVLAPSGGAAGSGIWSRYPMTPLDPVGGTTFRAPRARLALSPGRTVVVTAAHPSPPLEAVRWQRDHALITDAVRSLGAEPQVVGGDFNATRDHGPFRALLDAGLVDAADVAGVTGGAWPGLTWPADRPFPPVMRLDHVLVSAAGLGASDAATVTVPGTDHRGVLTTVTLR